MNELFSQVKFQVNSSLYLKDPTTSDLGNKILCESVNHIYTLGFEHFTFKKLAIEIKSTEASIYRYFESKQKLLLYLINWYWSSIEYRLVFELNNIEDPKERLKKAIYILVSTPHESNISSFGNESKLKSILINESTKVIHTKDVDFENKEGAFAVYKSIVMRVAGIIFEINPRFKYANMLVSTIIEGSNQQRFFENHLPRLTNKIEGKDSVEEFFMVMVFKTILDE